MRKKKYKDVQELCSEIQNYIDISKYNLKRATNQVNPATLTFVCSCICKKIVLDHETVNISETEINSQSNKKSNLRGLVKRYNLEACTYRISFKKLSSGEYCMKKNKYVIHNHPPDNIDNHKVRFNLIVLIFLFIFLY